MTSRDTIGREPITIIELDQDSCALVYGVAPCQAVLGVTGLIKCHNTILTCQDDDNFDLETLTLRFSTPMEANDLGDDVTVIPSLISVDTVPTVINIGGADKDSSPLGQRAKITASLRDHPYHDRLVDKYWDERDYDPASQGTFWSKWLARNPYHLGRPLRVRQGYVGQALADMDVRHYIIERIDGPSKGVVEIIAQDPLKLLDGTRRQAPTPNTGMLAGDIDEDDLAFTLSPAGIGNSQYPTSGIARIGSELVSYNRSADAVTLTSRGRRFTAATTHSAGDVFQDVLEIVSRRVDVLLADLLINYAGIDAAFIPTAEWAAEADLWLNGFDMSTWITEPTGLADLVAEILQQGCCFIWWDEQDQEVKFRAVRSFFSVTDSAPIAISDDANIVADSVDIVFKPDERISQVLIHYAQIDPTKGVDDPANYDRTRLLTDTDAESSLRYNERRVKEIFARFLDDANDAATSVLASRILERHVDTPKVIKFATDAKDTAIRTGGVVSMIHHGLVDVTGENHATLLQITSSEEDDPGHRITFEARPFLSRTRYAFIMANGSPVYSLASDAQKETGAWIAPNAMGFANGDRAYRIL